ncbi:SCO family protein [Bradyrhizobium sediminis]|nr:SCO family protein [Bradyrhizobium sediminis]
MASTRTHGYLAMPANNLKVAGIGAALAIPILVFAIALTWPTARKDDELPAMAGIGGPFTLVDHRGKSVTERDYLGKPTLIFFGFTHCPDVCPTTLFELTTRLKELGPDADRLNVVFITVDPERDTPQQLALYLSSFDARITGLSGTQERISDAMTGYRVYARKVPLEGGDYTMDHTATIYMMNSKGQFTGLMNYQEPEMMARVKLRRLIDLGAK